MFYSENLLAKEGPLAQVWLAANLERKLSKQQFLASNITNSTQAIMKATTENEDSEALALRLSGQLLYGVVRIYSRKAKYLLDDVSDALLKLKSAFRSSVNTVTLPVSATIVPSVNQLILQDTITQSDLLFQEPLVFDDDVASGRSYADFFGATQATTNQDFDDSIEIPRNKFDELDDLKEADDDLELDLNFDIDEQAHDNVRTDSHGTNLEFDQSIEVGRAADDANLSAILANRTEDHGFDDFDLGGPDMDLGFDDLDPIAEDIEDQQHEPTTPPSQPAQQPKKQRKARISTAGQRKIVSDRDIEIPVTSFNNTEGIVVSGETHTVLDLHTKRAHIDYLLKDDFLQNDITQKLLKTKRQKTVASPPAIDDVPELEHSEEEINGDNEIYDNNDQMDFDFDFGDDNYKVPINAEGHEVLEEQEKEDLEEEQSLDTFNSSGSKDGISESTIKISAHLRDVFAKQTAVNFSDVVEKDTETDEPLSSLPKSEATRVFFELLVLGTGDAIQLKQDELFGEIQIESRSNLFSKFL